MKFVEFYKLQNDGSQKVIATCKLMPDGRVVCEGSVDLVKNITDMGIINYDNSAVKDKLFLGDGLRFLEQLKYNFKSGYLNASEVKG